ncbi:entericidin A/B family lipoprotein [Oceaniferula flava]|nr:entericidin A/B family lipoprotein [Oceaniferula flavus]
MKLITTIILASAGLVALTMTSCNTIAGVGKDIQRGGAALENTALSR